MKLVFVAALAVQGGMLMPWLFGRGTQMDEGGVLTYAGLVFRGDLPMRDVRSFDGPLNSYVVGAVLKVAGGNLYGERLLGLTYRLVLAAALFVLVRHRGPFAVAGAAVLLVLLPPTYGLSASASRAALAATCVAIALASRERPFWAGTAAGVAVLMRFDWVLPVGLASIPWLLFWPWRMRLRTLAGFGAVVAIYVPYLAVVGLENVRYSSRLLRVAQSARGLPIPSWPNGAGTLLDLSLLALAALVLVGLRLRRTTEGRIYLSVALLTIGLLPYVTSRADRTHILTGALAPIVLLAAVLPAALAELRPRLRPALLTMVGATVAGAVLLVLVSVVTLFPAKSYAVSYHGRTFLLSDRRSAHMTYLAVKRADQLAPPGGRLFVGPCRPPTNRLRRLVHLLPTAPSAARNVLHRARPWRNQLPSPPPRRRTPKRGRPDPQSHLRQGRRTQRFSPLRNGCTQPHRRQRLLPARPFWNPDRLFALPPLGHCDLGGYGSLL